MNEDAVTSHVRMDAANRGCQSWRNNSGGFYDERGRFVRYGLGSFTPEMKCKSSDYIGITPLLIMPHHVGTIVGVFTALEMKHSDWVYNPRDEHSLHQRKFIDIVLQAGGYAGFATSVQDFRRIIRHE